MARFEGFCWKCGTRWEGNSQPGRADTCTQCGWDLHVCHNCEHHDPRYHNECRIPEAEMVKDRDRSNFCEDFQLSKSRKGDSSQKGTEEARKKLGKLFGGG